MLTVTSLNRLDTNIVVFQIKFVTLNHQT